MTDEIWFKVRHIVAGTRNAPDEEVKGYMKLKDDLLFDDDTIRGLTPSLNALLKPYRRSLFSNQVLKQETVSDVIDLVEKEIDEAKKKRAEMIGKKALAILADATHVKASKLKPENELRGEPLFLDEEKIQTLRGPLNKLLAPYGTQITITAQEIGDIKTIGDLTSLVKKEVAESTIF